MAAGGVPPGVDMGFGRTPLPIGGAMPLSMPQMGVPVGAGMIGPVAYGGAANMGGYGLGPGMQRFGGLGPGIGPVGGYGAAYGRPGLGYGARQPYLQRQPYANSMCPLH